MNRINKNLIIQNDGKNYQLVEQIGDGGSGIVWKAICNGSEFAIKFLNSENSEKIERFKKEILFCKSTKNCKIIKYIGDGTYCGKLFYIMPYYAKTFRNIIDEVTNPITLTNYIINIAKAISYIHKNEIIHRDLKPENILVNEKMKKIVLADFGIAHFKDSKLTNRNSILANRNYFSPEQKKGSKDKVGQPSDIYSFGIIINECFTKENLTGLEYKLIQEKYHVYSDLDNLVEKMINQDPKKRIDIKTVVSNLLFIKEQIRANLAKVKKKLLSKVDPSITLSKKIINEIINRASQDIIFSKSLLLKDKIIFNQLNLNWHKKIGYSVNRRIFNICVVESILRKCKYKFEYESCEYKINNIEAKNILLDLSNSEHQKLYFQMQSILKKYAVNPIYDYLPERALKYFACCKDYHCDEILKHTNSLIEKLEVNLLDTPILFILYQMNDILNENNFLLNEVVANIEQYIEINWDRTKNYIENKDDLNFKSIITRQERQLIDAILLEFRKRFNITATELNDQIYSIKFNKIKEYLKFKKFALAKTKCPEEKQSKENIYNYYIFEGDVLSLLSNENYFSNIVELKIDAIFTIPNTLAKILELEEII